MQTMSLPRRWLLMLLAVCAAASFTGCSTTSLFTMKKAMPKASAKNPAVEILAIWQPSEGRGDSGVPTRGFAGQFLFFTGGNASPVEVDGTVRIYLFDDRGTAADQAKPIHQFDFDPGAWKSHLRKSALGPAYHVFIPYPRKDDMLSHCSLRVRLTPTSGPTIYSESANVVLPGSTDKPATELADGKEPSAKPAAKESMSDAEARKLINTRLNKVKQKQAAATSTNSQGKPAAAGNAPIATLTTSRNRTVIQTVSHEVPADDENDVDVNSEEDSEPEVVAPAKPVRRHANPLSDEADN